MPQKALTKTFWYPIVKQIGKAVGIKVTKSVVAQGFSKAIPVIGGVISGSLNFASMMPMANRLQSALDSAAFGYSEEDLEKDIIEIESISENTESDVGNSNIKTKVSEGSKKAMDTISGFFSKKKAPAVLTSEDPLETIKKLSDMKENGIITQEEFEAKKTELLAKI